MEGTKESTIILKIWSSKQLKRCLRCSFILVLERQSCQISSERAICQLTAQVSENKPIFHQERQRHLSLVEKYIKNK